MSGRNRRAAVKLQKIETQMTISIKQNKCFRNGRRKHMQKMQKKIAAETHYCLLAHANSNMRRVGGYGCRLHEYINKEAEKARE